MNINELPKMNLDLSETKCCPKFQPETWDEQTFTFEDKRFIKMKTCNFMYVPLNMGRVLGKSWRQVEAQGADTKDHYLLLSHDCSPWKAEHYMEVTKEVEGLENVTMSGVFLTKVFEGPFKEAPKWAKAAEAYAKEKGKEMKKLYFFYTTCPKCIKHWKQNYVVAFIQVD